MKRLTCALLVLTLCLTMAACGEKTETKGTITEGLCYEATGISPDETVVTVDGVEIPMDIYYYFLMESTIYAEQFLGYYGMELDWEMKFSGESTVADVVREEAYLNAVQLATIETLVDKYDIALNEAAKKEMDDQLAAAIEQVGGEDAYYEIVANMGLRPESYERIRSAQYLQEALQQYYLTEGSELYVEDDVLVAFAKENGVMTADHILFGTVDELTRQPLDEATIAERKAQAEKTLADLRAYAGDDLYGYFAELGAEYSTDPGRALNPEGYTFGPGQMVQAFESGAAALAVGEVRELIETEFGYHIILRKELNEQLAANLVRSDYFAKLVDEIMSGTTVEESDKLAALDVAAAYDAFLAVQNTGEDAAEESVENAEG